ncbi:LytTR family DNA-binding domain-containing protein [Bacillus sp. 03113]|uniref:LytR/AlgR family response regulator transcription factor n=1 Tax=Bacillus sp. 03113 TaxID=2578211 RepID=UPI001143DF91|nr:LytTR family transcriptional regulator DNA-binding domain-containing protein [Bacillus sp. 03113]
MIKAFVVDDEPLARDELMYLLRRTKLVDVIGEAEGIEEALLFIKELKPSVVFLDIQLAEENGLELAKKMLDFEEVPEIVFATAFDEYALKAFDVNAVDYILKPFDEQRVQQTIEKLEKRLEQSEDHQAAVQDKVSGLDRTGKLAIHTEDRIILLQVENIIFIGSMDGKTFIKSIEREYKVSDPLVVIERKLKNTSIVRVHRSFLVNFDAIKEIQPWFHSTYNLLMKDGSKVPVSRTYVKLLKQMLNI